MNILPINTYMPNIRKSNCSDNSKSANTNLNFLGYNSDVVELCFLPARMPEKMEFTQLEAAFRAILLPLRKLEHEVYTLKENLKKFYSAQDRIDYREVLKQKNLLSAKRKAFVKRHQVDDFQLTRDINVKSEYNRYAPKVFRANTIQELNELQQSFISLKLFEKTNFLLNKLIEQRRKELT